VFAIQTDRTESKEEKEGSGGERKGSTEINQSKQTYRSNTEHNES
jgi:hypothetical protein